MVVCVIIIMSESLRKDGTMPATQDAQQVEVLNQYYQVHLDQHTVALRGTFGNTDIGCYAIVAVVNTRAKDWSCYIGVAPKESSEDETITIAAATGHKMSPHEAGTW